MASDTIHSGDDLPSGWTRSHDSEAHLEWLNEARSTVVSLHNFSRTEHLVLLEQYLSNNGLASRVTTHGATFQDQDVARARALDLMTEVSDGQHLVDCVLAIDNDDAVDFVCISPNSLPEGVTRDDIADVVDAHLGDGDPDELPDDATSMTGEDSVSIDIYPRPATHVVPANDVEVGEPTAPDEADAPQVEP